MKILIVTPFYEPAWRFGGMARATTGLARALGRQGHDVLVVTTRLDAQDPLEDRDGHTCVRRFESRPWLNRRLFPWPVELGRFLEMGRNDWDIAHVAGHRNGLAVMACRALRRARVPWVVQPHGTYPNHGARRTAKLLFDWTIGNRIVRKAAALVAVSEAEASELPRSARIVPNGVERVGSPTSCGARRERDSGRSELLFVGSDAPQKRGRLLAEVLRSLSQTRIAFVGPFGTAFRRELAVFGKRVVFRGVLSGDDLASAYADANLLVQPAVGEAFGLAPFEAALHGTASVVAGGHGCGEWYARAGGCVVGPHDTSAMVAAVRARLGDPRIARSESTAVARFVTRELSWNVVAPKMIALYRDILNGGRS
jgi:glycosyltransferase involved in cell wall biosynthesis